ncbi:MAG: alpha/beta hydrolase [Gammaproteobacteria bacterium]|jgi:pimeloyl-ACP methyl ester carboxylesterase|nr:alpha/beta hydrolase [Gammaproteobacteria bacterium]
MMVLKKLGSILFLVLLSISGNVRADVLILVHGYQGSVFSWENSGVSPVLQQFGWKRAGILVGAPQGLVPLPTKWQDAENKVINLQLNSEAPLSGQANVFTTALRWVNDRYPSEKIIIAGHSLGGVVARLSMVRSGAPNVKALITIASPHLGTVLAYRGLDEIDDPFPINKIKEFFAGNDYDMLLRSRGLLHDIVPAVPGKLLHWLNTRQHPPIKYYSIVRSSVNGVLGDPIVPGFSQDMGNVQAIGKNSTRTIQGFSHNLSVLDGYALVNILEQL